MADTRNDPLQSLAALVADITDLNEVVPDETAAKRGYLRIVDESGEDYLYPEEYFCPVQLPEKTVRTLMSLVSATRSNTRMPPPAQKTRRG